MAEILNDLKLSALKLDSTTSNASSTTNSQ